MENEMKLKNPLQLLKEAMGGYAKNFLMFIVVSILIIGIFFITYHFPNLLLSLLNIDNTPSCLIGSTVALFLTFILSFSLLVLLFLFYISFIHESNIRLALINAKQGFFSCFCFLLILLALLIIITYFSSSFALFFLLLLFPFISLLLIFAVFVSVIEKKKGIHALLKSYSYVKGKWIALIIRAIIPILVTALVCFIYPIGEAFLMNVVILILLFPVILSYGYRLYLNAKTTSKELEIKRLKWFFVVLLILGLIISFLMLILIIVSFSFFQCMHMGM